MRQAVEELNNDRTQLTNTDIVNIKVNKGENESPPSSVTK